MEDYLNSDEFLDTLDLQTRCTGRNNAMIINEETVAKLYFVLTYLNSDVGSRVIVNQLLDSLNLPMLSEVKVEREVEVIQTRETFKFVPR